jgi:hypothetical protein
VQRAAFARARGGFRKARGAGAGAGGRGAHWLAKGRLPKGLSLPGFHIVPARASRLQAAAAAARP